MTKITEQEMKVWMAMENRYYSDKEVLDVRTDRMVGVRSARQYLRDMFDEQEEELW